MKSVNKIIIDKSADEVWKVLADDFDKNSEWMAIVPKSKKMTEGKKADGASMAGRACDVNLGKKSIQTHERIHLYDKKNYILKFDVLPQNVSTMLPVNKNNITTALKEIEKSKTELIWEAEPDLKPLGKLLSPLIKFGLQKSFGEIIEEFKYFVETGKPHPRKIKALGK